MSSKPSQNPLIQQLPVNPDVPDVVSKKLASSKLETPTPTPSVSLEDLEYEIANQNKLILERLTLENAQIEDYIATLRNQRSTDKSVIDNNSYYYNLLNNIYTPLFFIYFICVIILGFFFFVADSDLSLSLRVLLMVLFILYPFVIFSLENWIISWFNFFYNYIRVTPIGSNPIKDALNNQPFLYSQQYSLQNMF